MEKSVIKVLSSLLLGATMMCVPITSLAAQSNRLVNNNKMAQKGYSTNLRNVAVNSYGCGLKKYGGYETGTFTRSELENNDFWIKLDLDGYGLISDVTVEYNKVKYDYDTMYYGSNCSKKITISDDIFHYLSKGKHDIKIVVAPSSFGYGNAYVKYVTFNIVEG